MNVGNAGGRALAAAVGGCATNAPSDCLDCRAIVVVPVNLTNSSIPLADNNSSVCAVLVPICFSPNNTTNGSGCVTVVGNLASSRGRALPSWHCCNTENVAGTPCKCLTCKKCHGGVNLVLNKKDSLTLIKELDGSGYKIAFIFKLNHLSAPALCHKRHSCGTGGHVHGPKACKPPKKRCALAITPRCFTF